MIIALTIIGSVLVAVVAYLIGQRQTMTIMERDVMDRLAALELARYQREAEVKRMLRGSISAPPEAAKSPDDQIGKIAPPPQHG